jgi:uncharacterized membrane protein
MGLKLNGFFLVIGMFFSVLAGLMTILISYNELVKHYTTKKEPIKISLKSAAVTLVFFVALSFIISFFIKKN